MMVTVRRIRPDDAALLRATRLAALLDTPSAFARTHAEEVAYDDDHWAARAAEWAEGREAITLFAELDGVVVGLVGGHRLTPGATELVSMWTAPSARGRGVGRALVEGIIEWADDEPIELWVTQGNDPAMNLYQACGFRETEAVQPLPSDPCRNEVRMRR